MIRRRVHAAQAGRKQLAGVAEVLPLLYLHGLSSQDFGPALEQFLGSAQGLSATTITRLTTEWQTEAKAFNQRSLAGSDYVYVWADGIYLKVRLAQDKVCLLVTKGPGSRAAGIAMAFKLIESSQRRWRAVNAPHLVALVRAGAHFDKGRLVERPDGQPDHESGDDAQAA